MRNLLLFLKVKFRINWFGGNCPLGKIATIGEATFIRVVFPPSSRGSMKLVSLN